MLTSRCNGAEPTAPNRFQVAVIATLTASPYTEELCAMQHFGAALELTGAKTAASVRNKTLNYWNDPLSFKPISVDAALQPRA